MIKNRGHSRAPGFILRSSIPEAGCRKYFLPEDLFFLFPILYSPEYRLKDLKPVAAVREGIRLLFPVRPVGQ